MSFRTSGPFARLSILSAAALALSGLAATAAAQTAPQLLPYTTRIVAGGGTSTPAKGGTCPVSGFIATDAYGDGCLATEVLLGTSATAPGPRDAVADAAGNIFFGDFVTGVVHRIDAVTGVLTAIAGSAATSPTTGCSTDARGDGCLATLVHLSKPSALVFSPAGDLYIGDIGYYNVRKVSFASQSVVAAILVSGGTGYTVTPIVTFSPAPVGGVTATGVATISNGVVTAITITNAGSGYTSAPTVTITPSVAPGTPATAVAVDSGIISLTAGTSTATYGYTVSNSTTTVTAAQSVLDNPYGLAFDNQGDLLISDEYTAAVLALNTNATGTTTVNSVPVPAGTIWKIAGSLNGNPTCTTGSGCTYNHLYTESIPANTDYVRNAFAVAIDTLGNTYITDEYSGTIQKVDPTGILTTYVGTQGTAGKTLTRGVAPNIAIGSPFGVATDTNNNLYFTDALSGTVWRVDATTKNQYVIATGFGSSGTTFASTTTPGPGIFAISADTNSNVYFGDTEKNNVVEIASGTQFGVVGANQPVDTLDVHFAAGDTPATTGAYTITAGATNFSVGTATCTTNSDTTTDCLLPVTATPTVLGLFTGTLKVTSKAGAVGTFALSGIYAQSPVTRLALTAVSTGPSCGTATTVSTTTPFTLTASLVANGPNPPVGAADTITFYTTTGAVKTSIGTVPVSNIGSATAPVYGAVLSYTFATPGTYTVSATYSGDAYFKPSTGTAGGSITSSAPSFTLVPVVNSGTQGPTGTITAGQTALYSFNVNQNVYTGTISFAVTGLPANSTAVFSPTSITASGCSTTNLVALSIFTTKNPASALSGIGAAGRGPLQMLSILAGLGLALMIGLRRRRLSVRFGQLWMALFLLVAASGVLACNGTPFVPPATPTGTYTLTVTATGTTGAAVAPITFPLTVK